MTIAVVEPVAVDFDSCLASFAANPCSCSNSSPDISVEASASQRDTWPMARGGLSG